jgi:hypothetical protein
MQQQIARTSNEIKQLESRTAELERRRGEITAEIAMEQAPAVLESRNKAWRLGLVQPTEQQVERIYERPEDRLMAKRNAERFAVESSVAFFPIRLADNGAR